MRNLALKLVGFTAIWGALGAAGCRSAVQDFYEGLRGSGGSGTGGSGGSGGTGGLPDECQGDPTKDTSLAREQCGAFVDAAAATGGDGTRAAPYKTIADAAKTNKSRLFICSGNYSEKVTVELVNGVEVYGGFTQCAKDADWQWDDSMRAALTGPANVPAVKVSMGQTLLRNLDVTAPDATAPGASSIAVIADSAVLDLKNVALQAGTGANGADGAMPGTEPKSGQNADPATVTNACDVAIFGGKPGVTVCDDGNSQGGDGGKGGMVPANNGEPGTDGAPLPEPNDGYGLGGTVKADGTCSDGDKGKDGDTGAAGKGASDNGSLTANGISGGAGEEGHAGGRAQGGGGGAGAKAGTFCVVAAMTVAGVGASGGGGGGGGCGGKGGGGGAAGGSSIAIVSLNSTFTFAEVVASAAAGGKGGNGVLGNSGGPGGLGSPGGAKSALAGSKAGCAGASGGAGGDGGRGGGGRGGHSLGIAFTGATPSEVGIKFELGEVGTGGEGDLPDGIGGTGLAESTLEFGAN